MLAAVIMAAAVAHAAPPPPAVHTGPPTARQVVERQLESRNRPDAPPPPAQSGAEASAVMDNYLRSIGRPASDLRSPDETPR